MWAAAILVALAAQRPMLLEDQRGPYPTEAACEARVVEMIATVRRSLPGVVQTLGRCVQVEDGQAV